MSVLMGIAAVAAIVATGKVTYRDMFQGDA